MTIQENIEQRKFFQEVLDFLESEKYRIKARFWQLMLDECKSRLALPPEILHVEPFNDVQARSFEQTYFTYGMFKNKTVMVAPTSYLIWLAEGDDFIKSLRRYIKSEHFTRLQNAENQSDDDE